MHVTVIGAGPAGCSAALAALGEGAAVSLYEKSKFPRHKVCGEFLSPEVASLLNRLGVWEECEKQKPAVLNRIHLSIGKKTKSWRLAESARGLSRYRMDHTLLAAAVDRGATLQRQSIDPPANAVLAYGRYSQAPTGRDRLFGFKAHFEGVTDDLMSLYFFDGAYVGVNAVEGGATNVCGLASERTLAKYGFQPDEFLHIYPPLRDRIRPLSRSMPWLLTGPLVFGPAAPKEACYAAGDSAAFIDPFTGSGMLGAISTGILAGVSAAQGRSRILHARSLAKIVQRQQRSSTLLRCAISWGLAECLLPFVPGPALFHLTRPRSILK